MLRRQLTAQLAAALGSEPDIASVSLGMRWHTATGIAVRSNTAESNWLTIEHMRIQLPLWQALRGNFRPQQLIVDGLSAQLQLDENGNLVGAPDVMATPTELPSDNLVVRQARIEIQQPNRRPAAIEQIACQLRTESARSHATAQIPAAFGGSWIVTVDYSPAEKKLTASVSTDDWQLDTDQCNQLAGMPSWDPDQFSVRGNARVHASIDVNEGGTPTYRAEVQLDSTQAYLLRDEIKLDSIRGAVTVDDGLFSFREIKANTFGAGLKLDGDLRVTQGSEQGQITVQVDGLPLHQVPAQWGIPADIRATMSGAAQLRLTAPGGTWQIAGSGRGQLAEGSWRGIAAEELGFQFSIPPSDLEAPIRPPAGGQLRVDFRFSEQDLPKLLQAAAPATKRLEQVTGKLSLAGHVVVPLQTASLLNSYSAQATLSSAGLGVADLHIPEFIARVQLQEGRMAVQEVAVQLQPAGRLSAQGDVDLEPQGLARLQVTLLEVPVGIVQPLAPVTLEKLAGAINGNVDVSVPWTHWQDPSRWQATASFASQSVTLDDVQVTNVSTQVQLENSQLKFTESKLMWQDTEVAAQATVPLKEGQPFTASFHTSEVDLAPLLKTAGVQTLARSAGQLTLSGQVDGTLVPLTWRAAGRATVKQLRLLDRVAANISTPWSATAEQLHLDEAEATLLGGTVNLTATVPWQSMQETKLVGRFESLDCDELNEMLDNLPARLSGKASGSFRASNFSSAKELTGHVDYRGLSAKAGAIQIRDLSGSLDIDEGKVDLKSSGGALEGTVAIEGLADLVEDSWRPRVTSGTARFRNVRLQTLWPLLGQQQQLGLLRAFADADISLVPGATRPTGHGSLALRDVQWGSRSITPEFSASWNCRKRSSAFTKPAADWAEAAWPVNSGTGWARGKATWCSAATRCLSTSCWQSGPKWPANPGEPSTRNFAAWLAISGTSKAACR